MEAQTRLLRVLQQGEYTTVGGRTPIKTNVRIVAATNKDLRFAIQQGAFREDLFFRLNVIRLCIPPLRERAEDVPLLVDHFLGVYSTAHRVARPRLAADTVDLLVSYRWPGNIRQLKNVIERIVLKHGGQLVQPADLPADLTAHGERPRKNAPIIREEVLSPAVKSSQPDELLTALLTDRESFWSAVYPLFMARDLTRSDLRKIIQDGLERTNGNYRLLVELFNMPTDDYRRFLDFLRKYDCLLPFQRFRTAAVTRLRTSAVSSVAHN